MDNSQGEVRPRAFKVIIVGPQAVGKSSVLFRLSEGRFSAAYLSTVGIDFKTYAAKVGEKSFSLQIWDTAGQEKFRALTSTYYKGSQGCVCVFDLADLPSLEHCAYYLSKAFEEGIPKECIVLLGNKDDITHEHSTHGKDFAEKFGVLYRECSALEGTQVTEVFNELAGRLAKSFGEGTQEGSGAKPKVNVVEGKRNCCGK